MLMWTEWNGDKVVNEFESACRDSLRDAMEATGGYIDNNTVPHDTGDLARSKHIEDDPNEVKVWIGYGGGGITGRPIIPYARKWHEIKARFQKGRTDNYVRMPMNTVFKEFLKRASQQRGLKSNF